MHRDILSDQQVALIPLLQQFKDDFYLAGGTAIALQLGHRKSIDFDLFSSKEIDPDRIAQKILSSGYSINHTLTSSINELTLIVDGVKMTFLYYRFNVATSERFEGLEMPDILTLGATKLYTIGRRSKRKDYVDVYSILQAGYTLRELSDCAKAMYSGAYNEKILREQLCYFDDMDYSEEVDYIEHLIPQQTIQDYLYKMALSDEGVAQQ